MRQFTLYILLVLFTQCDWIYSESKEDIALARVGEEILYLSEFKESMPVELSSLDSSIYVKEKINRWVEENVLLQKAELNLSENKKDFSKQLEEYRRSLVIFEYEKELIRQNLDTSVTQAEITEYYDLNKKNFELKDYVVRVWYVKTDPHAPKLNKLKSWLNSDDDNDLIKLEDYCHQFATGFFLDENSWLLFDDLIKEIPIETYNVEKFLLNNSFVEIESEGVIYMLKIKDYKLKNSVSPIEMEKEKIRNLIINKRKIELLEKVRKELIDNSLAKNQIEIYEASK